MKKTKPTKPEKQVSSQQDKKKLKPGERNPTGKGGFRDNPQNRNPGGWNPDMTFSYQYRRFMNMSITELEAYAKLPKDQRTVVEDLAYKRINAAQHSLQDVKEITNRVEGLPDSHIDLTTKGESLNGNMNDEADAVLAELS